MRKYILTLFIAGMSMGLNQSCKTTSSNTAGKTFKFNFQKGKGYSYDMISDLSMNMMGMDSKIYVDGKYSIRVTNDDGVMKTIELAYKALRMKMNMLGMNIDIDSDKPAVTDTAGQSPLSKVSSMMNNMISSVINRPFSMKVDTTGEIREIEGLDKMMEAMADSLHLDSAQRMQMMPSFKKQFGENNIKNSFNELLTIFPNKEIKVGDSWTKSYNTAEETPMKQTTNFTVKQIDGDAVTLDAETKITSANNQADISVDGTKKSVMLVDSKTGLMINDDFTLDIKVKNALMEVSMSGKGRIQGTAL